MESTNKIEIFFFFFFFVITIQILKLEYIWNMESTNNISESNIIIYYLM